VLFVNRRDGTVRRYDLRTEGGRRDWSVDAVDPRWLGEVSAVALGTDGHRIDLPRPRRFRDLTYSAGIVRDRRGEAVAERVVAVADGVVVSLTMHLNGRSGRFRLDVDRRGTPRFRPDS
jgi:hypothetical protein